MKLLIKNAEVLCARKAGRQPVGIDGGLIEFVGDSPEGFTPDETIDASRCVVMPGLVNAHTHSAMTLLRNLADDCAFDEWLFGKVIPFENKLTDEDVRRGAELAAAEMLLSGTTAFADMYIHAERTAEVVMETGMRANLSRGPITSAARGGGQTVDERACSDFIKKWGGGGSGRIIACVEIHSAFLYDPDAIAEAALLAKRLGVGIHIHISESHKEQRTIREKYGATPTELCERLGVFEVPVIAAHCVHVSDGDISILASKGVSAVHNPTSNLKLANGVAPVGKLLKAGVNVALGTDSCCSNNNLNMFEELHLAATLHKGVSGDAEILSAEECVKLATVNGARALGFDDLGRLEPGQKADLIIIDADAPHLCPLGDAYAAIAYSAQASDVRDVVVDGKVLVRNRELKTVDLERAMRHARRLRGEF